MPRSLRGWHRLLVISPSVSVATLRNQIAKLPGPPPPTLCRRRDISMGGVAWRRGGSARVCMRRPWGGAGRRGCGAGGTVQGGARAALRGPGARRRRGGRARRGRRRGRGCLARGPTCWPNLPPGRRRPGTAASALGDGWHFGRPAALGRRAFARVHIPGARMSKPCAGGLNSLPLFLRPWSLSLSVSICLSLTLCGERS